ncbi:MAG: hypothetical protein EBZ49_11130 [Proteobacteria bacterium]|nr:hypothetical protein [Pseudomonadota bacterium]
MNAKQIAQLMCLASAATGRQIISPEDGVALAAALWDLAEAGGVDDEVEAHYNSTELKQLTSEAGYGIEAARRALVQSYFT